MDPSPIANRAGLNEVAFDRLVRLHRSALERYVRGLGASREDAEELAATALLRAYENPPDAGVEREWRAWLRSVARNLWIDDRRRRQLRLVTSGEVLERVPSASGPIDQIASAAEEARQICAAIALLPPTQRAAIYLREIRGLSYEEIACELAIPLTAVTSTLHRARANIKRQRGKFGQALSHCVAPFLLLRRAISAGRAMALSGASAKLGLPVLLIVAAGGATLGPPHFRRGTVPRQTRSAPRVEHKRALNMGLRHPPASVVRPDRARQVGPADSLSKQHNVNGPAAAPRRIERATIDAAGIGSDAPARAAAAIDSSGASLGHAQRAQKPRGQGNSAASRHATTRSARGKATSATPHARESAAESRAKQNRPPSIPRATSAQAATRTPPRISHTPPKKGESSAAAPTGDAIRQSMTPVHPAGGTPATTPTAQTDATTPTATTATTDPPVPPGAPSEPAHPGGNAAANAHAQQVPNNKSHA